MIALIDYGISNLRSVQKAFEHLGVEVMLVDTPEAVAQAERLILPGVGAFPAGMEGLRARGLLEPIKQAASSGKPLLGICLGMQLLFESSDEMGDTQGLGILPGQVKRMTGERLKIPHMGWNQLEPQRDHPIMRGVTRGAYGYFVHSYAVYPDQRDIILATTEYGMPFASVVGRERICGLQFHPEKSQAVGLTLLRNFLEM